MSFLNFWSQTDMSSSYRVFYSHQGNPMFPLHRILDKPQYNSGCSGEEIDP